MTASVTTWIVPGIPAGLIILFDKGRKTEPKKNNTSCTKSYVDAVKKQFGPQGSNGLPWQQPVDHAAAPMSLRVHHCRMTQPTLLGND